MRIQRFLNDLPIENLQGYELHDEVIDCIVNDVRSRINGNAHE